MELITDIIKMLFFRLYSSHYDNMHSHEYGSMSMHNKIYEILKSYKNCKILDIGCGTGLLMKPLLEQGYCIDGVDNSINMLKEIKKKIPHATIFKIDLDDDQYLPLDRYQVIICNSVLQFTKRPRKVLDNLSKKLVQNGIILIGIPHQKSSSAMFVETLHEIKNKNFFHAIIKAQILIGWRIKNNAFWDFDTISREINQVGLRLTKLESRNAWGILISCKK